MSLGLTISFTVVVVLLVVAALGVLLDRTARINHRPEECQEHQDQGLSPPLRFSVHCALACHC